eukprot:3300124-Pyramimonas_sp.AAC.1
MDLSNHAGVLESEGWYPSSRELTGSAEAHKTYEGISEERQKVAGLITGCWEIGLCIGLGERTP